MESHGNVSQVCLLSNVHFPSTPTIIPSPCCKIPRRKSICSPDAALINACPGHKACRPSLKWHSCTSCPVLFHHYPPDFCSTSLLFLQSIAALLMVVQPHPLKLDYSAAQLSLLRSTQLYLYCIFVARLAQYLVSVPNCTIGNLLLSSAFTIGMFGRG